MSPLRGAEGDPFHAHGTPDHPPEDDNLPGSHQALWLWAQFSLHFTWFFSIKRTDLRRVRKDQESLRKKRKHEGKRKRSPGEHEGSNTERLGTAALKHPPLRTPQIASAAAGHIPKRF